MDAVQFSIWKREVFRKVKEIKHLSGGVVVYAAQSNVQIDAEIAEKSRFRTKTRIVAFDGQNNTHDAAVSGDQI